MRARPSLVVLPAVGLMVLAGCSQPVDAPPAASPPASPTGTPAGGTPGLSGSAKPPGAAVPATLRFTGTTLDGAAFNAATLAGKPTLLWFWAPWCTTCAGQAPHVSGLAARHAGKINVVGVAGLGERDAMREFVTRTSVNTFVHLADDSGQVWRHFKITEQSTYTLLDAGGAVLHAGHLDNDELAKRLDRLAG